MRWDSLGIKSRDSEGKLKSSGDMIVEISRKLAQFKDGPVRRRSRWTCSASLARNCCPCSRTWRSRESWSSRSLPNRQNRPTSTSKDHSPPDGREDGATQRDRDGRVARRSAVRRCAAGTQKKNDNVTDSAAKKLRWKVVSEDLARIGARHRHVIDGARAVPTVFGDGCSFIAGTAGELVSFGKVANAVAYILANPGNAAAARSALSERSHRPKKMIGEAGADFDQMAETFTKGSFRRAVEEQFALADATKGSAKAAETARKSLDDYSNANRPVEGSV